MLAIPECLQFVATLVPYLIFIATWRLTFYSVNYAFMGIAEWGYNFINNVYEIHNKRNTSRIVDSLYALTSDTTEGRYNSSSTRGKERAAALKLLLEELSDNEDYYYTLPSDDVALDLTDRKNLETIVTHLTAELRVGDRKVKPEFGILRLIEWINNQYRLDKGREPKAWDEVLPMTIVLECYGEDMFFNDKELLEFVKDAESEELTHRLGMLAKYKTELFLLMVNRLTKDNSAERQELLKIIDEPTYIPSGIKTWAMWQQIKYWVNAQLPTTWANARTQKRTLQRIYGYYADHFEAEIESRKQKGENISKESEVERKTRVILRHIEGMKRLSNALGGDYILRDILDALIETGFESTLSGGKGLAKADIENKLEKDECLREMFSLIRDLKVFPTVSYINKDWYHGAKWNQKTSVLPYLIGQTILTIDGDHRAYYSGTDSIVSHLLEFFYLPGLGASIRL
jgi:hypothetical protein